ncbi:hypothetical protein SRABI76_03584 [Microbacterium oxydans]|nr:hypothetical protein SRABI76_03584 [Microbacterium oxydans]
MDVRLPSHDPSPRVERNRRRELRQQLLRLPVEIGAGDRVGTRPGLCQQGVELRVGQERGVRADRRTVRHVVAAVQTPQLHAGRLGLERRHDAVVAVVETLREVSRGNRLQHDLEAEGLAVDLHLLQRALCELVVVGVRDDRAQTLAVLRAVALVIRLRPAGLVEQCAGGIRIEVDDVLEVLLVVGRGRRQVLLHRIRTEGRTLHDRSTVDAVQQRLAHPHVVERRGPGVQVQRETDARQQELLRAVAVVALHLFRVLRRDVVDDVCLARDERVVPGLVLGEEPVRDRVEVRSTLVRALRPPVVVVVAHVAEALPLDPLVELERPGADHGRRERIGVVEQLLRRDDAEIRRRDQRQEARLRLLQRDAHGVLVEHLGDRTELRDRAGGLVRRVGDVVEVDLHGLGVERGAVMERDVVAQRERVHAGVIRHLPLRREPGAVGAVAVVPHEGIDDRRQHVRATRLIDQRVELRRLRPRGDDEIAARDRFAVRLRCIRRRAGSAGGQGECGDDGCCDGSSETAGVSRGCHDRSSR